MTKKEIEKLFKEKQDQLVYDYFKKLPNKVDLKLDAIYVMLTDYSMGCNDPVISKKDEKTYQFDSYGKMFKNYREWDRVGQYGMCGSFGYTTSLKCVFNSCLYYNREYEGIARMKKDVYKELKKEGYKNIIVLFNK